MRRVREAVHARHYEQYERKVQEARDGDDDEHFVGRVTHAVRGGGGRRRVQHVWRPGRRGRRRRSRRRVVAVRDHHAVVPAMVPRADDRGGSAVRGDDGGDRDAGGRPSVGRGRCRLVMFPVVSDRPPLVNAASRAAAARSAAAAVLLVVAHRSRSTTAAGHSRRRCDAHAPRSP